MGVGDFVVGLGWLVLLFGGLGFRWVWISVVGCYLLVGCFLCWWLSYVV